MPTAIITGANSGIGHAWAELLIKDGYEVHAVDTTVGDGLKSLSCHTTHLDVTSPDSISAFTTSLSDKPIDVLLNVAGIMIGIEPDSLEQITRPNLTKVFEVNTFGPLLLTQALLSNLLRGEQKIVGIVSSRVGSIADDSSGGIYAYTASKAAVDLKGHGVVVSLLHPGYVRTGLMTRHEPHPESVKPEEAARKMWVVPKGKRIEETGRFWHREGQELPS